MPGQSRSQRLGRFRRKIRLQNHQGIVVGSERRLLRLSSGKQRSRRAEAVFRNSVGLDISSTSTPFFFKTGSSTAHSSSTRGELDSRVDTPSMPQASTARSTR